MRDGLLKKLQAIQSKHQWLHDQLSLHEVIQDQKRYQEYAKEASSLDAVVDAFKRFQQIEVSRQEIEELSQEEDAELREMLIDEQQQLKKQEETVVDQIKWALIPDDPDDDKNVYLEIRAGTGGDEAS